MKRPFNSNRTVLFILLVGCISLYHCSKTSSSSGGTPPGSDSVAITALGTPLGNPVTQTIGPSGGTLKSSDGEIELTIPAGALSANTNISIQEVTNTMPSGLGSSYDLLPNGTHFDLPVTISFHYNDDSIQMDPGLLFIAYQDSLHSWTADLDNRVLDTVDKKMSLDVSHFTTFSIGRVFLILSDLFHLKKNETTRIHVEKFVDWANPYARVLIAQHAVIKLLSVTDWSTKKGQIININGTEATYQAPADIPEQELISVHAIVNAKRTIRYHHGPGHVTTLTEFLTGRTGGILFLDPDPEVKIYNFHVAIEYADSSLSGFDGLKTGRPTYFDQASFDLKITIDHGNITLDTSNRINKAPTMVPAQITYHGSTFTWLPDVIGIVNIDNIFLPTVNIASDSILTVLFTNPGSTYPGWKIVDATTGDVSVNNPPSPYPGGLGLPKEMILDLKKADLTYSLDPTYAQTHLIFIITQQH